MLIYYILYLKYFLPVLYGMAPQEIKSKSHSYPAKPRVYWIQCSLANANSVKAKFRITRILTRSPRIAPIKTCTIKVLLSRIIRVMTVLTQKRGGAFDITYWSNDGKAKGY